MTLNQVLFESLSAHTIGAGCYYVWRGCRKADFYTKRTTQASQKRFLQNSQCYGIIVSHKRNFLRTSRLRKIRIIRISLYNTDNVALEKLTRWLVLRQEAYPNMIVNKIKAFLEQDVHRLIERRMKQRQNRALTSKVLQKANNSTLSIWASLKSTKDKGKIGGERRIAAQKSTLTKKYAKIAV